MEGGYEENLSDYSIYTKTIIYGELLQEARAN